MKNALLPTQLRLLTSYIGLYVLISLSIESSCSCRNHDIIDPISPTPSLEFTKLSYDRNNNRLIVIIKNTGKEIAKDLSLQCTNISENEASRMEVLFNNTVTATTISIPNLAADASTQDIYIDIDFQTAKEALVQMKAISGQQKIKTDTIQVNRFPIDLLPKGPIIVIAKQGEKKELKWKFVTDEQIDFTTISLKIYKVPGTNIDVSVEGTMIVLNQSKDSETIKGADVEKLAKQQEILVKVKNNTAEINCIFCILLDRDKEIAKIGNILVLDIGSALLTAASLGDVKILKQTITEGAGVNTRNTENKPALHIATQGDHLEIVKILLEKGADVNAPDNDGNTALHMAAGLQRKEILENLLAHGADKNIKNKKGETAVDLAKEQDMKDLINNWKN